MQILEDKEQVKEEKTKKRDSYFAYSSTLLDNAYIVVVKKISKEN
jgi:hypothetical protein